MSSRILSPCILLSSRDTTDVPPAVTDTDIFDTDIFRLDVFGPDFFDTESGVFFKVEFGDNDVPLCEVCFGDNGVCLSDLRLCVNAVCLGDNVVCLGDSDICFGDKEICLGDNEVCLRDICLCDNDVLDIDLFGDDFPDNVFLDSDADVFFKEPFGDKDISLGDKDICLCDCGVCLCDSVCIGVGCVCFCDNDDILLLSCGATNISPAVFDIDILDMAIFGTDIFDTDFLDPDP